MEQLSKVGNGQAAADPVEKRRSPRFPFSTGAESFDIQANVRVTGRLSDISRHGCYMDMMNPFPLGTNVSIRITDR